MHSQLQGVGPSTSNQVITADGEETGVTLSPLLIVLGLLQSKSLANYLHELHRYVPSERKVIDEVA